MMVWVLCVLMWSGTAPAQTTIDRILAVVNGDPITLSDVRAARTLGLVPAESSDGAVVELLIERRLVSSEMYRFQAPDTTSEILAARRAEWQTSVGAVNPSALFEAAGVTAGFLNRWLSDDLRREAYLGQRFAALDATRRADAIRLWIEGLRARANVVRRIEVGLTVQRF